MLMVFLLWLASLHVVDGFINVASVPVFAGVPTLAVACFWRTDFACVTALVCVPVVAGIPAVAGVPLIPDVLTVAAWPLCYC
jgi:hypothetical protein